MTRVKFMLLGQTSVGKSCLLTKFTTGQFTHCFATIGQSFELKQLMMGDEEVTFQIHDMAGLDVYKDTWRMSYPTTDAVLLVYDVTNVQSFFVLPERLRDLRNYNLQAEVLLVGNKNDDLKRKEVTVSMIKEYAEQEHLEYIETSAMTGENVDEAFYYLAKKVLFSEGILFKKPDSPSSITSTGQSSEIWKEQIRADTIKLTDDTLKKKSGCSC